MQIGISPPPIMGSWCSLVSTSACQAEGRGFEPRRPRQKHKGLSQVIALCLLTQSVRTTN